MLSWISPSGFKSFAAGAPPIPLGRLTLFVGANASGKSHRSHLSARWAEVRLHCDPKEEYVDGVMANIGTSGPGGGRKAAMRALAGQWTALKSICPELESLVEDVKQWAAGRS